MNQPPSLDLQKEKPDTNVFHYEINGNKFHIGLRTLEDVAQNHTNLEKFDRGGDAIIYVDKEGKPPRMIKLWHQAFNDTPHEMFDIKHPPQQLQYMSPVVNKMIFAEVLANNISSTVDTAQPHVPKNISLILGADGNIVGFSRDFIVGEPVTADTLHGEANKDIYQEVQAIQQQLNAKGVEIDWHVHSRNFVLTADGSFFLIDLSLIQSGPNEQLGLVNRIVNEFHQSQTNLNPKS